MPVSIPPSGAPSIHSMPEEDEAPGLPSTAGGAHSFGAYTSAESEVPPPPMPGRQPMSVFVATAENAMPYEPARAQVQVAASGHGNPWQEGRDQAAQQQAAHAAQQQAQQQWFQMPPMLQAQQIPVQETVNWLVREVTSLREKVVELERRSTGQEREKRRFPMKDLKAYLSQPKFVATPKEFEKWVFGFRDFLRQEAGFESFFDWAQKSETPPTAAIVKMIYHSLGLASDDVVWFDGQLYSMLCGLCSGDDAAMSILRNSEQFQDHRGFPVLEQDRSGGEGQRGRTCGRALGIGHVGCPQSHPLRRYHGGHRGLRPQQGRVRAPLEAYLVRVREATTPSRHASCRPPPRRHGPGEDHVRRCLGVRHPAGHAPTWGGTAIDASQGSSRERARCLGRAG